MSVKFIAYDEPVFHPETGKHIKTKIIGITFEEALKIQNEKVKDKTFKYASDQEAIEDFIVVNWAWIVEIP